MKISQRIIKQIFFRYILVLLIGIFVAFTPIFYKIFLPITIYPANLLLNLIYSSLVVGDSLLVGSFSIEIIPACVAVSAYFLLLILNLTTPIKKIRNRIISLIFSIFLLLLINILRIFILSLLLINNFAGFDAIHKFLWYSLSILIVAGIWFLTAYLFKIKSIPVYTDVNSLLKLRKTKKEVHGRL